MIRIVVDNRPHAVDMAREEVVESLTKALAGGQVAEFTLTSGATLLVNAHQVVMVIEDVDAPVQQVGTA